jgi:hypothetical protein
MGSIPDQTAYGTSKSGVLQELLSLQTNEGLADVGSTSSSASL